MGLREAKYVLYILATCFLLYHMKYAYDEVNRPMIPTGNEFEDRFFLTWRNTDHPPLHYEDVDSDDGAAVAGLEENYNKKVVSVEHVLANLVPVHGVE